MTLSYHMCDSPYAVTHGAHSTLASGRPHRAASGRPADTAWEAVRHKPIHMKIAGMFRAWTTVQHLTSFIGGSRGAEAAHLVKVQTVADHEFVGALQLHLQTVSSHTVNLHTVSSHTVSCVANASACVQYIRSTSFGSQVCTTVVCIARGSLWDHRTGRAQKSGWMATFRRSALSRSTATCGNGGHAGVPEVKGEVLLSRNAAATPAAPPPAGGETTRRIVGEWRRRRDANLDTTDAVPAPKDSSSTHNYRRRSKRSQGQNPKWSSQNAGRTSLELAGVTCHSWPEVCGSKWPELDVVLQESGMQQNVRAHLDGRCARSLQPLHHPLQGGPRVDDVLHLRKRRLQTSHQLRQPAAGCRHAAGLL